MITNCTQLAFPLNTTVCYQVCTSDGGTIRILAKSIRLVTVVAIDTSKVISNLQSFLLELLLVPEHRKFTVYDCTVTRCNTFVDVRAETTF